MNHIAPGASAERRIEVSNTTAATAHVLLYSAAAAITDGQFAVAAGHTPNDLSSWTTVSTDAVDVAAGKTANATVTINVPRDAAPGEQYAALWAEVSSVPSAPGTLVQISRVGIRLYVSVGPGGAPAADFAIDSLTAKRAADGAPVVVAAVHNVGGRALDMSGTLQLSDGPGGLSAGPFDASLGVTLAIGATEPVTVALDRRVPAGPWTAEITLHSGLVERHARATITFPVRGSAAPVKSGTEDDSSSSRLPIAVAIAAALVFSAATAAFLRSRRLRRRTETLP